MRFLPVVDPFEIELRQSRHGRAASAAAVVSQTRRFCYIRACRSSVLLDIYPMGQTGAKTNRGSVGDFSENKHFCPIWFGRGGFRGQPHYQTLHRWRRRYEATFSEASTGEPGSSRNSFRHNCCVEHILCAPVLSSSFGSISYYVQYRQHNRAASSAAPRPSTSDRLRA